jgi:hypothetical protein
MLQNLDKCADCAQLAPNLVDWSHINVVLYKRLVQKHEEKHKFEDIIKMNITEIR